MKTIALPIPTDFFGNFCSILANDKTSLKENRPTRNLELSNEINEILILPYIE